MTARRDTTPDPQNKGPANRAEPVAVVVLVENKEMRESVLVSLAAKGLACVAADSPAHAVRILTSHHIDVVVLDEYWARHGSRAGRPDFATARKLSVAHPTTGMVILAARPAFDDAVAAMQAGASDIVPAGAPVRELHRRVMVAAARCATARGRSEARDVRSAKLKTLCRTINKARHDLTRQLGSMCQNLAGAYKELSEQMAVVRLTSEFDSVIRQELDLESLLRVGVEFMLQRIGPTNAAVFLPAASGDFSLGAYVNYDRPKDTAEVLMDHLSAAIAPRIEHEPEVLEMNTRDELDARFGDGAEWIGDCAVIAFSCRHEGECLAVFTLFRDRSTPYSPEILPIIRTMSALFARQLARVIHIHHRHLPKHKWGHPGDPYGGADDIDLAA